MKNVHLIPTDIPRFDKYLVLNREGKLCIWDTSTMGSQKTIPSQNVYITSDEYIGLNWYLDGDLVRKGVIDDEDYWSVRKDYKKIVLTNDPKLLRDDVQEIDEKFLNWFVDNSNCETVKVEKECCGQCDERLCEIRDLQREETKYNTFYKIIIPSEELKIGDNTNFGVITDLNENSVCFGKNKVGVDVWYKRSSVIKVSTNEPILYTEEEVRSWLIHRDVYLYNYYTTYKNLDIPLQSVDDFIDENHEYLMNREK
jgi:hypothetical protein